MSYFAVIKYTNCHTIFSIDLVKMTVYNTVMIENFVTIMERHNEFTPVIEIETGRFFNDKKELCKFVGDVSIDGIKYRYATRREIDFANKKYKGQYQKIEDFLKTVNFRGMINRSRVYDEYIEFCYNNRCIRIGRKLFYILMEKSGFKKTRRASGRYFIFP